MPRKKAPAQDGAAGRQAELPVSSWRQVRAYCSCVRPPPSTPCSFVCRPPSALRMRQPRDRTVRWRTGVQVHKDEQAAKRHNPRKRQAGSECDAQPLPACDNIEQEKQPAFPSWMKKSRPRNAPPAKTSVVIPDQAAPANGKAPDDGPVPAVIASTAPTQAKTCTGDSEEAIAHNAKTDEGGLVLPLTQRSTPSKASGARAHRGRDLVAMAQQTRREQAGKPTAVSAAVSPDVASDGALTEALMFLEAERQYTSTPSAKSTKDDAATAEGKQTDSATSAALSFLVSEKRLSDVSCLTRCSPKPEGERVRSRAAEYLHMQLIPRH